MKPESRFAPLGWTGLAPKTAGRSWRWAAALALYLCSLALTARSADVIGYSVLKGQFLLQTDADTLALDPDFAYSLLISVDLADFDLLDEASLRLPDGEELEMDNLGDFWSFLASESTQSALDETYTWGDYTLSYKAVNDGEYSCLVSLPEMPFPPTPRVVNFADFQSVNIEKPLTVVWEFETPPQSNDFVQVYVNLGHADIFATPEFGEPGALDGMSRSVTIPPFTFDPYWIQTLNVEVTRIASINSDCHPSAEGVAATFSSTAVDLVPLLIPALRVASAPTNGIVSIEVLAEPERPVVLEGSVGLTGWVPIATNTTASGEVVFKVPANELAHRFFRAWQQEP